jgi:hypothetical protein
VSDWGFDDLVAARVRAAAPHFAVRRIIFAREELARHKSPFSSFNVELKNFVRDVSAGANCERYVVVHLEGSKVFDSPESVFGLGIVNVPSPFQRRNFLFAITNIRIYDGQSFEVIRQDLASTGEESLVSNVLRFTPFRGPKRELDDASFPVAPLQATSSRVLREGVRALLAASLDRTLPALLRDDTEAEREVHTLTSCQPTACAPAQAPAQSHDVSKRISR